MIVILNVILSLKILFGGFVLFLLTATTINLYQVFVCFYIIMLLNIYCDVMCLLIFVQKKEEPFQLM